jgi:hypothetical protein
MQTDNYKKQSPINEIDGGSMSVHHLLTADEFIARWNRVYQHYSNETVPDRTKSMWNIKLNL